jgi:hypothetical protein
MRQGGDPRLPLELALVKVTRPASDLSREAVSFRLERLEQSAGRVTSEPPSREPGHVDVTPSEPTPRPEGPPAPDIDLEQLQEAWARTILPAVEERGGIPTASLLREAHPALLAGDTLTVEFPPSAQFHRSLAEDPRNVTLLSDALYDVTGRRLALAFAVGEDDEEAEATGEAEGPAGEDAILELMKETLDAKERGDS